MFMEEFRFFGDPNPEVDHINFPLLSKTFLKFVTCAVMDNYSSSACFFYCNRPNTWRQFRL